MSRFTTSGLFILFLGLLLPSQSFSAKLKVVGQIITHRSTMDVTFSIPYDKKTREVNYMAMKYEVKYRDKSKIKFTGIPVVIREFNFMVNNEEIRMVSRRDEKGKNVFLKLEVDGRMKVFSRFFLESYTYTASNGKQKVGTRTAKEGLLQLDDGRLVLPNMEFSKDAVADISKPCPWFQSKVLSGEYPTNNLMHVAQRFNSECGKREY